MTSIGAGRHWTRLALAAAVAVVVVALLVVPMAFLVRGALEGGLDGVRAVLGTSESNAGTRVHRAVTKLRKACHAPA